MPQISRNEPMKPSRDAAVHERRTMQIVDESEVRKMIRKEVKEFGSQCGAGHHRGQAHGYISTHKNPIEFRERYGTEAEIKNRITDGDFTK